MSGGRTERTCRAARSIRSPTALTHVDGGPADRPGLSAGQRAATPVRRDTATRRYASTSRTWRSRADAPVPLRPVGADGQAARRTVVIPVHDGGPVVLACLASVLASLPADARVLVVDDGSSDPP